MNKLLITILLILAITFSACGSNIPTEQTQQPIKIGATLDLTGIYSTYGINTQRGLSLAINKINFEGGVDGRKIELIVLDNKGDAKTAATDAQQLININDVDVIYSDMTHITAAVAPIAKENNKLVIYMSTVESLAVNNDNLCMDYNSVCYLGKEYAKIAQKEGATKVGVLYSISDFGNEFVECFETSANEANLTYVKESYTFGVTDLKTQITKFKEANVDFIVSANFDAHEIMEYDAIGQLNYGPSLKGVISHALTQPGKSVDKITDVTKNIKTITSSYNELDIHNKITKEYLDSWNELYSETPIFDSIYSYDDVFMIKKIVETCGDVNLECAKSTLMNTEFETIEGKITFNDNCIAQRKLSFFEYESPNWKPYEYN